MKYPNGSEAEMTPGFVLIRVKRCPCEDGVARTATVTGLPTNFSSIAAKVNVKGKTISGVLSFDGMGYKFMASPRGRNARLLTRRSLSFLA